MRALYCGRLGPQIVTALNADLGSVKDCALAIPNHVHGQPPAQERKSSDWGGRKKVCVRRGGGGGVSLEPLSEPLKECWAMVREHKTRSAQKAQKEMWLVSGLQDHRYLSVNKDAKMPVDGPLKKQSSVKTRRSVCNQRHAGFTGSICQPVTEFTYNWKRRRPLPPGPRPQTD